MNKYQVLKYYAVCCFDESSKLFIKHQNIYKLLKGNSDSNEIKQEITNCQLSKIAIAMIGESIERM